jgi:hypothetical protein
MTALQNFDQYIDRIANTYFQKIHFAQDFITATTATLYSGQLLSLQVASCFSVPSLPAGVSGLRLVNATLRSSSIVPAILGKVIYLGTYNYGTGVFTDGTAMPTVTEGNISRAVSSSILAYVSSQLTLTSGTVTTNVQYTDQDGNVGAAAPSFTFTTGATVGTTGWLRLATGDVGATDVTNITVAGGGTATGIIQLLGIIPLGMFRNESRNSSTPSQLNFICNSITPPLLNTGDQLVCLICNSAAKRVQGTMFFVGEQP